AREVVLWEKKGLSQEELEELTLGSLKLAVIDGDIDKGSFMAGQIAGLLHEIRPVKAIIESLFLPLEDAIKKLHIQS
ncbi:MAG: hypothetical protein RBQ86_05030, partial [Candidatus Izemoplasmatales bacterium]|nr:hypothetical protein [Candidatus Izemoplasmatales bacterium]